MKIYRKRYIPNEIVDISKDKVVFLDERLMITEWLPINPRNDIYYGKSYTFFEKGWKISKFYGENNKFLYWYCDIIDAQIEGDTYTLIDLLVDVKVYEDGTYEVLDLDELDEAVNQNLITESNKQEALEKMNELVKLIKENKFPLEECI